jgi:transposase
MQSTDHHCHSQSTVQRYDGALFVALELSKSIWLIGVSAPGSQKMSKYRVAAGDIAALWSLLARLKVQAEQHHGSPVRIVSIHEAGLDGFWVHRVLEAKDVESHVVDAAVNAD